MQSGVQGFGFRVWSSLGLGVWGFGIHVPCVQAETRRAEQLSCELEAVRSEASSAKHLTDEVTNTSLDGGTNASLEGGTLQA